MQRNHTSRTRALTLSSKHLFCSDSHTLCPSRAAQCSGVQLSSLYAKIVNFLLVRRGGGAANLKDKTTCVTLKCWTLHSPLSVRPKHDLHMFFDEISSILTLVRDATGCLLRLIPHTLAVVAYLQGVQLQLHQPRGESLTRRNGFGLVNTCIQSQEQLSVDCCKRKHPILRSRLLRGPRSCTTSNNRHRGLFLA